MKAFTHTLLLLAIILIASSCATIFTGTSDNVSITSNPEGARIMIDGIERGHTPATLNVKRPGLNDTRVSLHLNGYQTHTFILQKDFNMVSILNLSNVLGWAIDALSGALFCYTPMDYNFTLRPSGTSYNLNELPTDSEGNILVPSDSETVIVYDEESGASIVFSKSR